MDKKVSPCKDCCDKVTHKWNIPCTSHMHIYIYMWMYIHCWYSNRLLIGNAHPSHWVELNIYCPYPAIFIHSHFKWFNILRVWQHPKRWRKLDKSNLSCMIFRFQHPFVGDYNPVYDMFNHLIHQLLCIDDPIWLVIRIQWIINHQAYIYLWYVPSGKLT